MRKIGLLAILAFVGIASAAVNFPFPQNSTYGGRGIRATNASAAIIQSNFVAWMGNYYVESGTEARIKFDDPNYTVSEGIGYGMLAMVYLSDNTTSYQAQFTKLWTYYKNRRNNKGLMNWKISGFGTTCNEGAGECNGATDGDLDVALALVQGYYQFGVASFLTDAQALIGAIRAYEIENTAPYYLRPGDAWNTKRNPSYFSPAHMQLFQGMDNAGASKWASAITDNYAMLSANQHSSTGLLSDWCNNDGAVNGDDKFGYEGVRIPWRLAMGYYWYGQSNAKTILDKMGTWIISKTANSPAAISSEYNRSTGNLWAAGYPSASFTGAFATSVTTNTANQTYLNAAWTRLFQYTPANQYYHGALQVLNGLLISGNMPNLAAMTATSSSSGATSSSSAAVTDLIDDVEDGNYLSKWGGEWYTYNDNTMDSDTNGLGASTVTPSTSKGPPKVYFTPTAGGATGSASYGAKITFTLDSGTFIYAPFVGMGVNMRGDEANHSLSTCTQISYKYKGSTHRFRVESAAVTNANFHGIVEPTNNAAWTTVTLGWNDLLQEDWGATSPTVDIDKTRIKAFSWQVQGAGGTTGNLIIDDVKCAGGIPPSSSSGTVSSSSVAISSSSVIVSSSSIAVSSSSVPVSSSSVVVSSSSAAPANYIDNMEDGNNLTLWYGVWYTYRDAGSGGASVITPLTSATVALTPSTVPGNGSIYATKVTYTLAAGTLTYDPYVGLGFNMRADTAAHNLTSCTEIRYDFKGAAHRFRVEGTSVTDANFHGLKQLASTAWKTVTIPFNATSLTQDDWGATAPVAALDKSKIKRFSWQVQAATGSTGDLWIDNVQCIGGVAPPAPSSSSAAVSSSSVRPSSSSSVVVPSSSSTVISSSSVTPGSSSSVTTQPGLPVSGFSTWGVFVDAIGSTVTPPSGSSPVVLEGGVNVARASMTILPEPAYVPNVTLVYPFVGMFMQFNPGTTHTPANLTGLTGITITYQSAGAIRMALQQVGMPEGQEYGYDLPAAATWTTITIPLASFEQPGWITTATPLALTQIYGVKWELKEAAGGTGSIAIQAITFPGATLVTPVMARKSAVEGLAFRNGSLQFGIAKSGNVRIDMVSTTGVVVPVSQGWMNAGSQAVRMPSDRRGMWIVRVSSANGMSSLPITIGY